MEQRFCHQCGAKLAPGARFCNSCGTPVMSVTPAPAPVVQPAPAPAEEIPAAALTPLFNLDDLSVSQQPSAAEPAPVAEPEPEPIPEPAPAVLTLDALMEEPASASEPVAEPVSVAVPDPAPQPEPDYSSAPTVVLSDVPYKPAYAQPVQQPVYQPTPQPTVPHAPAAKADKGVLVRRGAGRTVLAVLLCIVIFLWSFVTLTLFNVRLATNGLQASATIEAALRSVDLTEVAATDLIVNADEDLSLSEWVLGKASELGTIPVTADEDDLQEFLEESDLIPYVSQLLSDSLNDIYQGETRKIIDGDDIEDFLLDNEKDIEQILGQEINHETAGKIAASIEDSGMLDQLSTKFLKNQQPAVYTAVNIGLSWWVLGGLCLVLVLLFLLLWKVDRSILRACGDAGIVLMVASGIWGIAGLLAMILPDVINSIFSFFPLAGPIAGSLFQSFLIPTAAAFGLGVVLVLIWVLGKLIVSKRAAKLA